MKWLNKITIHNYNKFIHINNNYNIYNNIIHFYNNSYKDMLYKKQIYKTISEFLNKTLKEYLKNILLIKLFCKIFLVTR